MASNIFISIFGLYPILGSHLFRISTYCLCNGKRLTFFFFSLNFLLLKYWKMFHECVCVGVFLLVRLRSVHLIFTASPCKLYFECEKRRKRNDSFAHHLIVFRFIILLFDSRHKKSHFLQPNEHFIQYYCIFDSVFISICLFIEINNNKNQITKN